MTQLKSNHSIDKNSAENLKSPFIQGKKINPAHNMSALNLRWQAIRKWELNRLRIQELNHQLAFSHTQPTKQDLNTVAVYAKNDHSY